VVQITIIILIGKKFVFSLNFNKMLNFIRLRCKTKLHAAPRYGGLGSDAVEINIWHNREPVGHPHRAIKNASWITHKLSSNRFYRRIMIEVQNEECELNKWPQSHDKYHRKFISLAWCKLGHETPVSMQAKETFWVSDLSFSSSIPCHGFRCAYYALLILRRTITLDLGWFFVILWVRVALHQSYLYVLLHFTV
jgi:hypothetical protein